MPIIDPLDQQSEVTSAIIDPLDQESAAIIASPVDSKPLDRYSPLKGMLPSIALGPAGMLTSPAMQSAMIGGAQGLTNVPIGAANLLANVGIREKREPFKFAEKLAPVQEAAKVGEFLGPMAIPYAGEEALGTKIAGLIAKKSAEEAGPIANIIGKGFARGAYGGMAGSIFGSENPDEEAKNSAVYGALLNTVGRAPFEMIPFAGRSLTRYYRNLAKQGGITPNPEDAKVILDSFKNDVISYGDLVKSPKLRSFYHGFLKYVPFTGVGAKQEAAIKGTEKDAAKLTADLFGNSNDSEIVAHRQHIQEGIAGVAKKNIDEFSQKYSDLDAKADAKGITFKPSKTKAEASRILYEDIEGRRSGMGPTRDPVEMADIAKLLQIKGKQTAEGMTPIISSSGQDISEYLPPSVLKILKEEEMKTAIDKPISFSTYRQAVSRWKEKASNAYDKGDYSRGRIYKTIANSIDEDMQTSLEKSGNKDLFDLNKKINKEYTKKVVPFIHSEKSGMRNLTFNKVDLSTGQLESILRDTTNKEAILQLPQELKNKIGIRLLSNEIPDSGEFLTPRIAKAYSNLTDHDKLFFDTETKNKFNNLVTRNELLAPAFESFKGKFWQKYYKWKNAAFLLGIPFHNYFSYILSPAIAKDVALIGAPIIGAGRFLGSKSLKEAYTTGKTPYESLSKAGSLTGRGAISSLLGGQQ